ncbi:protease modulator HflC [Desulfonema ishimotonii]|uniref:Protein HflC n=1 Tax=Desulfonema ishimotonii TaxID=45657 RepID=A0A401FQT0_9BACT|nr:protease modulator HflC [Desulfonema ishimotonii]GBC59314.1 protease modulator HflC [Desulfonema ishimotonii]
MKYKGLVAFLAFIGLPILFASAYIVDETEQVVITQFGKIIGDPKTEPGLKFKIPFIRKANFFPKNLLQWDGDPGQIPTKEKTYIWVDTFARWKITDPVKFFQTVTYEQNAYRRLNDIIDPAVRNFITSNRLIETVRKSNRPLLLPDTDMNSGSTSESSYAEEEYNISIGREKITEGILKQAQPKLDKFGIELVDVKIKRINYEDTVSRSVYNRMIAERKQIAEKFRSEGKGEARKIIGQKERELKLITSEAYRTAQELKGQADATATEIFARAFGRDPDFYSFTKTLEMYSTALERNTVLVLSTDSEFLKYFKGYGTAQTP